MKKFSSKMPGILHASDLKTPKGKIIHWCMFIYLCCACVLAVFPSVWILLSAFKDTQEIYSGFSLFPEHFTLSGAGASIKNAWQTLELGRSILNTFLMSLGSLAMTIIVCGFGGYVLSRLRPRGAKFVLALVLWTMMMPTQMRTVPLYISWLHFPFASSGGMSIVDTYWPIWLNAAANAFNVLLFKNCFDSVPISLVEAGKIDGCHDIGIFFRIMVPLSMPVIIYVSILTMSGAWSEFFIPYLVLQSKELQIMPVKIFLLKSDKTVQMNVYMMGLIFASLPPFIIFLLFQKHIMGGVNIGGVKG